MTDKRQTNRLLGYPVDARLLLINADDFGMCQAINDAIFHTLTDGLVRSTTLMVPCPWALHAMHLLSWIIQESIHLVSDCSFWFLRYASHPERLFVDPEERIIIAPHHIEELAN